MLVHDFLASVRRYSKRRALELSDRACTDRPTSAVNCVRRRDSDRVKRPREWPAAICVTIDNVFYQDELRDILARMRPSEALTLHRAALRELLNRHGFRQARVFGSALTQTDTEESDLDVLVEPVRGTTLFTLATLEDEARQLTGVRVSVLTPGFLSPKFRDRVLEQAQPL